MGTAPPIENVFGELVRFPNIYPFGVERKCRGTALSLDAQVWSVAEDYARSTTAKLSDLATGLRNGLRSAQWPIAINQSGVSRSAPATTTSCDDGERLRQNPVPNRLGGSENDGAVMS